MERLNIVYECLNRCVRLQSYSANGWLNCLSEQKKEASYLPAILTEQVSSIIKDLLYDQTTVFFKEMEQAKEVHFTYSLGLCSQSEPGIRFFFPARRPAIHLDSRLRKRSNVKIKLKISYNRKQGDIAVQNNSYAWTGVKLSYFFVGGKGNLSW